MTETRKPQVGDKYMSLFQSDLDGGMERESLTVAEVGQLFDGDTWEIVASDGHGYDCVWSDRHQVWCYNLG